MIPERTEKGWFVRRLSVVLGCVAILTVTLLNGPAAQAASSAQTTLVVTMAGGTLGIIAPTSVTLEADVGASSTTGQFDDVSVIDHRGDVDQDWTATVSSTDLTSTNPAGTIPKGDIAYWSGPATETTGSCASRTPGQADSGSRQALDVERTAFSSVDCNPRNSTTWRPSLVVTIPATSPASTYSATITHSVA
jgi:hypothetical protein